MKTANHVEGEIARAEQAWGPLGPAAVEKLASLLRAHRLSILSGDLLYLDNHWYVTHSGLLRLASRRRCASIKVLPEKAFCDPQSDRWTFKATVFRSSSCRGFTGYGDANPSNVSPQVRGAEMRVAETRAVNRALRKAYGIGICSVEEIRSLPRESESTSQPQKLPPQPTNGSGHGGRKVRDRLCQIIRHHQLDADLVKAYAIDFCGVRSLREATREQVENFVQQLAEWAEKDRNALLCQLNSYMVAKEKAGAA